MKICASTYRSNMIIKVYVDWKTKLTTTEMYNNKNINFKIFEKIVNINIAETKRTYHNTFRNYENNMKQTWRVINDTPAKRNPKLFYLYLLNITIL